MKRLTLIFFLLIALTSFQTDFVNGDKVVLSNTNHSDKFFIGKTTTENVISVFGKANIETDIWKFTGKTEKQLFGKRQTIKYKGIGIVFIFEGDGVKEKKYAVKDTCLLDEIIITSPDYCLDNVCIGTTKSDIVKRFGEGLYGITNGIVDSTNLWYNPLGLTLTFDKSGQNGKLKQIHRQETESYFEFMREKYEKSRTPSEGRK